MLGLKSLILGLALLSLFWWYSPSALASLNDDHYDGNIYALYAGNGSLVPPKVTLSASLRQQKPALLVFYVNDSSDCKQFATVVSQLQSFYGRVSDFIPIDVDALPFKSGYAASEPGHYYQGVVPQTVLIDQAGQVVLNAKGKVNFEQIDDAFRQVFDLLPRSESKDLKRRFLNEVNTELTR
jgi:Thioredoxin-like domain